MNNILWLHFSRPRPRWYDASDDERDTLYGAWETAKAQSVGAGATRAGEWSVRGQSDYSSVEVWTFNDADAAAAHWTRLVQVSYTEWFAAENIIGSQPAAPSVHAPHITNWPRT